MGRHRAVFPLLTLVAAGACTDATSPSTGAIQVVVLTTGVDRDPDGYQIVVNQKAPVTAAVNDTLAIEAKEGIHTVVLGGLAANCVAQGPTQRQVTLTGGQTVPAVFSIMCRGVTGIVRVEAPTTGDAPDPDGYLVNISSPGPGNTMVLPPNGFINIPGLPAGDYVVTLTGVSPSCVVAGGGSRPVTVVTGRITHETAYATYQVACLGGVVGITAPTTGPDQDSAYTITVDGEASSLLRPADSLAISLEVGDHSILLGDLAPNCTVQGPNPIAVTIAHGARTSLSFPVLCLRNVATARISATMTGGSIDPSVRIGVDLVCDYWYYYCSYAYESPLPQNGSVLVDLSPGSHHFLLLDLSANCVVPAGAGQTIDLPPSDTVGVVFNVTCSPAGTVRVTTPTSGALPDNWYALFFDDRGGIGLPAEEGHTFEAVPAGQHVLALGDVSPSCRVAGENPRAIMVSADATTDVVFQVSCDPDASLVIVAPTTGSDLDNSYVAFVDNGTGILVPANGSVTAQVYGGVHIVTLTDLAFNCTVTGSHPVSVSVPAGGQATVTIPVSCTRYTGTARFTITTSGPNQPSSLNLDYSCNYYYGCSRLAVPANGVASVDLSPGTYLFSFASIPSNCTVSPANAVQLSIALGVTTDAAFSLICH